MAKLPVEIVRIGKSFHGEIAEVVSLIDNIQKEFEFSILPSADEGKFQLLDFKQADANELLEKIKKIRSDLKGFHPYLVVISSIDLSSNGNTDLLGQAHPENGVAVFTFNNVPEIVIPTNKIKAYIAYYIAHYTFNFLIPQHRKHDESSDCVFDTKTDKTDLINCMKSGTVCDSCRATVMSPDYSMSASQFTCLSIIFGKVQELLKNDIEAVEEKSKKPKIFVGSSLEGINIARKIQTELSGDFEVVIWNQGIFDKLGLSFLEILEETVVCYDYGIFIFTPDDKIHSRGETKTITRDNVIFELGMFVGRLTRRKAFLVYPLNSDIHILSDFAGITKAGYDTTISNLQAALGPVCDRIRTSIG
jgi:predicted nucleotide-binding protein